MNSTILLFLLFFIFIVLAYFIVKNTSFVIMGGLQKLKNEKDTGNTGNTENMKYQKNVLKKLPESDKGEEKLWEREDLQPNPVIRAMYRDNLVEDREGNKIKFTSGISPREGYHLYYMVKNNDISKVLEVGFANGTSALYVCQAFKDKKCDADCHMISIDPNQSTQWKDVGRLNIEKANLAEYHSVIEKSSDIALPELLIEGEETFDLAFVDGLHLFDYTLLDMFYSAKLLKVGGILVVDDIKHAGVKQAVKYFNKNYGFLRQINTMSSSTMATYVKTGKDKREWNFHKYF